MKKILKVFGKVLSFILSHKIYSILALVIIIGTSYYFYHRAHTGTKTTYQVATVQKGILTSSVSGSGNVIVDQSAKVDPSISGKVTSLKVKVGDTVKKGQFLFYIDNPQLDIDLTKAYASYTQSLQGLDNAQAQLLQSQLDLANLSNNSAIKKAAAALVQANQSVQTASTVLLQAQSDYNNLLSKQQTDPTSVTDLELKIALRKINSAKNSLSSAKQSAADAKADYNQQVANVGANNDIAKYKVAASQDAVDVAQKNIDAALASYDIQKDQAAKRYVTAPIAGTVTTLNIQNGDELGSSSASQSSSAASTTTSGSSSGTSSNTSSTSASSNTPMVIDNLDSLKASVAINEVDVPKVTKEQKVTLTFDAIPDLTLTGKVEKIDSSGTNTQNVITYGVTCGFDSLDPKVKPQMNVSAAITTDVKQDVLIVANSAVKTSGNTHYVQMMENGIPREQTVEVGIANDTETEITSGLKEGDTVVTQTISGTSTTTSTNQSNLRLPGLGGGGR